MWTMSASVNGHTVDNTWIKDRPISTIVGRQSLQDTYISSSTPSVYRTDRLVLSVLGVIGPHDVSKDMEITGCTVYAGIGGSAGRFC